MLRKRDIIVLLLANGWALFNLDCNGSYIKLFIAIVKYAVKLEIKTREKK